VARSGVVEDVLQRVGPYLTTTRCRSRCWPAPSRCCRALSKNIGALAMLMPVAFNARAPHADLALLAADADGVRLAARRHRDAHRHLAEHHRVARARRDRRRAVPDVRFRARRLRARDRRRDLPHLWLAAAARNRKAAATIEAAFNLEGYTTEVDVPEGSALAGKTVADLETMSEDEVEVIMIVRGRGRRYAPSGQRGVEGR